MSGGQIEALRRQQQVHGPIDFGLIVERFAHPHEDHIADSTALGTK